MQRSHEYLWYIIGVPVSESLQPNSSEQNA